MRMISGEQLSPTSQNGLPLALRKVLENNRPAQWIRSRSSFALGLALVALCFLAFFPVLKQPFLFYDDPDYVTNNPHARQGLDLAGVFWAFSTMHAANWHPLTWISHMLDCQLFGVEPAGHHLTNLLIHAANTFLVFLVLARATGSATRSLVVALLFAAHPLHIESVAWIAERKDVLSTFFFLLALWSYTRYSQFRSAVDRTKTDSVLADWLGPVGWYSLAASFFGCSLLSKPMAVTAPFVMLLFDFWPLKRIDIWSTRPATTQSKWKSLMGVLIEKIPFLAMSVCVSCLTLIAQKKAMPERLPLDTRVSNAVVAYGMYIGKFFWPARLSIFYPWQVPSTEAVGLGAVAIVAISLWTLWNARARGYLPVGWFWFAVDGRPLHVHSVNWSVYGSGLGDQRPLATPTL
jgi:hypothetical protein